MKRVGPELKMPEVKVPQGVSDFYQDLRDRRLLPVIALVVVAIAAVPFLLGESKEAEVPASTSRSTRERLRRRGGQEVPARRRPVDARASASYKKRLKGNKINPFKQRYTGPVTTNAQLGEGGGETPRPP